MGELSEKLTIIAHTAYSSPADMRKCYAWGMVDILPKPATYEEVCAVLQEHF